MSNINDFLKKEYPYGFYTDIALDQAPQGLNEEVIQFISQKKNEPKEILEFRLKAFKQLQKMNPPKWSTNKIQPIDLNAIIYYSAPRSMTEKTAKKKSLEEVDPEILKTFDRLGIPLWEQKRLANVAVDAIFDSVSIWTTHQDILEKEGVIFCSLSKAMERFPELVLKYLGSVVPYSDNYFATLNSAVFSEGSFCYLPKGVKSPLDISSYFRINADGTGQFERTLLIAEEGSFVNYLEGCTAPQRDTNQLHAAVVELIAHKNSTINYSTVQNWYSGDETGKGGIYNFVTKRGSCEGEGSKITWTQIETGSAITWKYPSVMLKGDYSQAEFYSISLTNHHMQADTGTKMIHTGKNTSSYIVSKAISSGYSTNTYRGLVKMTSKAENSKNFTQCDSMLIGENNTAITYPYIEVDNSSSEVAHEATTVKIDEEHIFYLQSRGIPKEQSISFILNGFCQEVFKHLPMEFSVEAIRLLEMKLEDSIG